MTTQMWGVLAQDRVTGKGIPLHPDCLEYLRDKTQDPNRFVEMGPATADPHELCPMCLTAISLGDGGKAALTSLTPGTACRLERPMCGSPVVPMNATRMAYHTETVTVVGTVPFEPGMLRVRHANGTVTRTLKEYLTALPEDGTE